MGSVIKLCQPNAFFFPVDIPPPREDDFSQEGTEDLKTEIPEEPSCLDQLDQPTTSDVGTSEMSQKPNTEKDIHPGKAC